MAACGGMISLVNGLLARIPENVIRLNHPVCEIEQKDSGIQVTIGHLDEEPAGLIEALRVILAVPPRLAARSISSYLHRLAIRPDSGNAESQHLDGGAGKIFRPL
ncbi:MAG: FAD-dependent oxidoreductase [Desulfobacterales bacterium]